MDSDITMKCLISEVTFHISHSVMTPSAILEP